MSYFYSNYHTVHYPIANERQAGLRNAQIGGLHSIAAHFTLYDDPAIVVMPTGTGKTAVLMLAAFVLRANRVLVVTPSKLVRNQISRMFKDLHPLREIGAIWGAPEPRVREVTGKIRSLDAWNELRDYDVVVGTPNSISPAYQNVADPPDDDLFDLLLIDEAHHSPAKTWNEIIETFPRAKKVLYTATPFRRDRLEIKGKFIYTYPLRQAYNDGIFSRIEYVPVEVTANTDVDVSIAQTAEAIYRQDRENGLRHFLLVRTDSKKRADELKIIYAANTSLNLVTIHSGHGYAYVNRSVDKLLTGELDGVICVNMFGEGFDFPNLKIAAIHSPHRSLATTLQFIGRFARTNADDIGIAKFVAERSEIKVDTERLYEEDAVWQELVTNLSQARIEREQEVREVFETFDPPAVNKIRREELSLYSVNPSHHVKIYRVDVHVDITKDIELPPGVELVYKQISQQLSTVMLITSTRLMPKWTYLQDFQSSEFDLFIEIRLHAARRSKGPLQKGDHSGKPTMLTQE